jgi:hypothetical protein
MRMLADPSYLSTPGLRLENDFKRRVIAEARFPECL